MIERTATVRNTQGIHCRPSATIVRFANGYAGDICVQGKRGKTGLRSIMELMSMELYPGTQVKVRVSGPDEEAFCDSLVSLFETHFDYPALSE